MTRAGTATRDDVSRGLARGIHYTNNNGTSVHYFALSESLVFALSESLVFALSESLVFALSESLVFEYTHSFFALSESLTACTLCELSHHRYS